MWNNPPTMLNIDDLGETVKTNESPENSKKKQADT